MKTASEPELASGGPAPLIPFNRPTTAPGTLEYVERAIAAGHLSGDGPFTEACRQRLQELVGSPGVLLTTSGTHALELSALLLGIGPDDEVVMPSFNFPSAANAFVLRGARPVFVDVRQDTLNLDESLLEAAIGPRTRAIVPVHYAGVSCEMRAIAEIASHNGIPIVEDIAHSLFGTYEGQPTGTFGALAAASFHETKNITCGEGGALFVNDPALLPRAEIIREKGTNRTQFYRGEVSKYSWIDVGSSYLPSDVLAAMLLAQLDDIDRIQTARAEAWANYSEHLADWATEVGATLPIVPEECGSSHHLFHLLMPTPAARDRVIDHLRQRGILAVFHYLPLHLSQMGRRFGGKDGDLSVTESISQLLVRLPLFSDITRSQQEAVIAAVREIHI